MFICKKDSFLITYSKKDFNLPLFSSKKYGTTPTKLVIFAKFTCSEEFICCNEAVKGNVTLTKSASVELLWLSCISE